MTIDTPPLVAALEVPRELRDAALARNWPVGLIDRAFELRLPRRGIDWWLTHDRPSIEQIAQWVEQMERLTVGTLRMRQAILGDEELLSDLWAHSPEDIGDWEVTVERAPNPFAQFRLQEQVSLNVLEDRRVFLGCVAVSTRNTIVSGKRTTVHYASALRVRREARGHGYGPMLRGFMPAMSWFATGQYFYLRAKNFKAAEFIRAQRLGDLDRAPERDGDVPGMPVTVHYFAGRPASTSAAGVRKVGRSDLARCSALINRTHRGLDLFRPYTAAWLSDRLDEGPWVAKPDGYTRVYDWDDYYVLEEGGVIVACAGLWDRGRDMREAWRSKITGESHVIANTALMDFGYARGREDAMERLIEHLLNVTDALGRGHLMAPIEWLPALVERLARYEAMTETRGLDWLPFEDQEHPVDVEIRRPYTDLSYW